MTRHPLADRQVQALLEQAVSTFRAKEWVVREFQDMNEFSSHPSALLADGSYSVFVKASHAANGLEQFEIELAGLRRLSDLSGIQIPSPIGIIPIDGGVVMVLEGVQAVKRAPEQWREIGRTLAHIHQVKGTQFGLETHTYFGSLYQDNRPLQDWPTFYAERRLWPRLMGAINAGHVPSEVIRQVETLILRVPEICGPEVVPTLLHGDAQHNNFISTGHGAVVIDPAVYYGNPEIDLAYVDYFHPAPEDLFTGYREILPIDPGFHERRDLWRVYGYLACVEVEADTYLPHLINAVRKYL